MMLDGKIILASLGIVMQLEMLTSSFEFVHRTYDTKLFSPSGHISQSNALLPGKRFHTLYFAASYTQTMMITDLQSVISR